MNVQPPYWCDLNWLLLAVVPAQTRVHTWPQETDSLKNAQRQHDMRAAALDSEINTVCDENIALQEEIEALKARATASAEAWCTEVRNTHVRSVSI